MARKGGIALKALQWFLRAIEFCCAAVVLALFAYFLARLHSNDLGISNYIKAIVGLSGAAVIYTMLAVLFVCCLGGFGFFALLAVLLDILFIGAFIFIAYETRGGAHSCSSGRFVDTPVGSGISGTTQTIGNLPSLKTACRMNTACFAVSIVAIVFFLLSALVEVALWRNHKSEKKYGPSPSNNYSKGSGNRKYFTRKTAVPVATVPIVASETWVEKPVDPAAARASYQTDNTVVGPEPVVYNKYGHIGNGGVGDGYVAPAHGHLGPNYGETARVPPEGYNYNGVPNTELPSGRY